MKQMRKKNEKKQSKLKNSNILFLTQEKNL